jgi:hypothetical protein
MELHCAGLQIFCNPLLYHNVVNLHLPNNCIILFLENVYLIKSLNKISWRLGFSPQFRPSMLEARVDHAIDFCMNVLHFDKITLNNVSDNNILKQLGIKIKKNYIDTTSNLKKKAFLFFQYIFYPK